MSHVDLRLDRIDYRMDDNMDRILDHLEERSSNIEAMVDDLREQLECEDFIKNIDKLNSMVNEFKGCVAMARGALEERKTLDGLARKKSKK